MKFLMIQLALPCQQKEIQIKEKKKNNCHDILCKNIFKCLLLSNESIYTKILI